MTRGKWMLKNIEEITACLFFLIMCIAVALGVFARFFEVQIVWTDELARYCFIWTVLLGSVAALKSKKHIAIDFLLTIMPKKIQKSIYFSIQIGLLTLFGFMIVYGWTITQQTWMVPTTSLGIPTGIIYLSVPVSCSLMFIYTFIDACSVWRSDWTLNNNINKGVEI
ncbi:TRAP transporter small permease [Bacillus sp. V2I10]|uniref:TRAP transporter small permease n=1 Tax=Bacillus sp. V2I10 TaxID=3042276 RepID=UPI0027824105|nr:TRAP transporter small permease [Bacillus sp. V2I10]MDQ0859527.1 TRAP-type C4-dicarboxylate transport system permease small subunit [Bacillus sp. V2I10]